MSMKNQPPKIDKCRGMFLEIPRWKNRSQIKEMEKKWSSDPRMRPFFRGVYGRKAFFEFNSTEHRDKMQTLLADLIAKQGNIVEHVTI